MGRDLHKPLRPFRMLPGFVLVVLISTFGGALIGWKRGSKLEQSTLVGSLLFHSVPSFFFGILLLMVFSYGLGWLPSGGMREPGTNLREISRPGVNAAV